MVFDDIIFENKVSLNMRATAKMTKRFFHPNHLTFKFIPIFICHNDRLLRHSEDSLVVRPFHYLDVLHFPQNSFSGGFYRTQTVPPVIFSWLEEITVILGKLFILHATILIRQFVGEVSL